MKKRLLSMLLSVSMIAGMITSHVAAANAGGLSVKSDEVEYNEEFTLTSEIPAITGEVNNVTMRIDFDNEVLEYTGTDFNENKFSFTDGGTPLGNTVTSVGTANQNGFLTYTLVVAGGSVVLSGGHTAHFTFKVKDQAKLGATTIQYNSAKTTIKNSTEVFTPANWSSSVNLSVVAEKPKTLQSVVIATPATKLVYNEGDNFDPTGLTVTATYDKGNPETVPYDETTKADFTFEPSLMTGLTLNDKTVKVSYKGKDAGALNITVNESPLESIAVKTQPTKTAYYEGNVFDPAGLVITATYANKKTADVPYAGNESKFTFAPALTEALKSGPNTITITYGGKETTLTVNAEALKLASITLTPNTKEFAKGEDFNMDGIVVTGKYNDPSKTETVTLTADQYTVDSSAYQAANEGSYTINVAAKDNSAAKATLTATVTAKERPALSDLKASGDLSVNSKLSSIKVSGTAKVGDAAVEGTYTFETPDQSFSAAGKQTVNVVFTPNDTSKYLPAYGTVEVNVVNSSSTGGNTGSSSGSTAFAINVKNNNGGTVSVFPSRAGAGDKVTLTVKPYGNYTLDGVTVTDKNGSKISVTDAGDGKYTFTMPEGEVTVEAAFTAKTPQGTVNFVDVSRGAYYYDAVAWAVGKNITTGTSNVTFSPDQACTRAQIVTFLWRAAGSPEPTRMSTFTDVSANDYYAKAVAWAVEKGITTGTSATTFSPNSVCTRAQAVTFLCRAVGTQGQAGNNFSDVPSDAYYAGSVAWAVANGVTDGVGNGMFAPDNNCTRAQIVTFLYRAYQGK